MKNIFKLSLLLFIQVAFPSCSPDYIPPTLKEASRLPSWVPHNFEKVEIDKNAHYPDKKKVHVFTNERKFYSFAFYPDSSMIYNHNGIDQKDFNKFGGIEYANGDKFNAAWRWNPDSSYLELNLFHHKKFKYVISEKVIPVPLDIRRAYRVEIGLDEHNVSWIKVYTSYGLVGSYSGIEMNVTKIGRYTFDMFGGNRKAPHKVTYYKLSNI